MKNMKVKIGVFATLHLGSQKAPITTVPGNGLHMTCFNLNLYALISSATSPFVPAVFTFFFLDARNG